MSINIPEQYVSQYYTIFHGVMVNIPRIIWGLSPGYLAWEFNTFSNEP
jgi:hypothetical protein